MTGLLLLADTHLPKRARDLPAEVWDAVVAADVVVHAGDWVDVALLDVLESRSARLVGCYGNNDGPDVAAWGAPETLELDLDGLAVAMIHDAGAKTGRLKRMRRRFPAADLVVFGHSHIPLDESDGDLRILNPGSPTDKRRQPHPTLAELVVDDGRLTRCAIIELR